MAVTAVTAVAAVMAVTVAVSIETIRDSILKNSCKH
jgi:hypothetical protein